MKHKHLLSGCIITLLFLGAFEGTAFAVPTFSNDMKPSLTVRPRLEIVDAAKSATALTNQLQFGVTAKNVFQIEGLHTVFEATKVTAIGGEYHSSSTLGGNVRSDKATVIDPPVTTITKAYLEYHRNQLVVKVGETPLNLDNQRFIGSVGWRQTPQTFGAVSLTQKINEQTKVFVAFLYRRNGIKPELNKAFRRGSVLLNGTYDVSKEIAVTGYSYILEGLHNTYGLRSKGSHALDSLTLTYSGEYAIQKNPTVKSGFSGTVDTTYYNVEVGAKLKGYFTNIGYEVLGDASSGTKGFSTPYATGHAFNGWSDALLGFASSGSNKNGLKDLNFSVGYHSKKLGKAMVVYHKFDSVEAGVDYGSEFDVLYKKKLHPTTLLLVKVALYSKGDLLEDTTKYWVMTQFEF